MWHLVQVTQYCHSTDSVSALQHRQLWALAGKLNLMVNALLWNNTTMQHSIRTRVWRSYFTGTGKTSTKKEILSCYGVFPINLTPVVFWVSTQTLWSSRQSRHCNISAIWLDLWCTRPQSPPPSDKILHCQGIPPRHVCSPYIRSITGPTLLSQMAGVPHGQRRATSACHLSRLASTCQLGRPLGQPCSYLSPTTPHSHHPSHVSDCRLGAHHRPGEKDDRVVQRGVSESV